MVGSFWSSHDYLIGFTVFAQILYRNCSSIQNREKERSAEIALLDFLNRGFTASLKPFL